MRQILETIYSYSKEKLRPLVSQKKNASFPGTADDSARCGACTSFRPVPQLVSTG